MNTPTLATIKRLFALSGNRCAFSDCSAPLVEESGTVTGEICHIRAANPGGPRYDQGQSDSERNSAANLLLLCARHHKLLDSEPDRYPISILEQLKRKQEQVGIIEITPATAKAAQRLLDTHCSIAIHANSGQIAIQSPGAIQARTVNVKTTKSKVVFSPPSGSVADNRAMLSYAKYLIERYQTFQKADSQKTGRFKYMAIHQALKREFKCDWMLLPSECFGELVGFLQRRIDNTKQGRINGAKSIRNYHSFEEHT
jgi:hypothetical protein